MCVHHFLRQIITSPLPLLALFPSILTAAWCVSQVQSLNSISGSTSISLPEETLYLLQFHRVGGTSRCWSFLYNPWGATLSLTYCIYGTEQSQGPPHVSSLLFFRFVSADLSPCRLCVWLSFETQGAGGGCGYTSSGLLLFTEIYHIGSKGQGFSSVGSAYICKTVMCL